MGRPFSPSPPLPLSLSPWLQVALIILVAAFFRLWQIESIPPGLFGDEAVEGLDALDVLAGRGQVFFPANYGREGLYAWLVAGSIKLFGVTPLAVRLPAILAGILTCVVAWWLAREWAGGDVGTRGRGDTGTGRQGDKETRKQGNNGTRGCFSAPPRLPFSPSPPLPLSASSYLPLLTGLTLATAYWHVHFSRFSQRTILTPLFVGLAAAAFWRGVNLGRTRWFLVAGAGLGLALHSYSVGRFFPVFLVIFLLLQFGIEALAGFVHWARNRLRPRFQPSGVPARRVADPPEAGFFSRLSAFIRVPFSKPWRGILLMFGVAAVIFAPLGVYFLAHPGSFMQRASVVATYAGGSLADTLALIGRAALANLAQYVLPGAGDQAQFHNLPGRPIFEPLTALLAVVGLLIALRRWREPRFLFLLLWLAILTAPAALATDRFPTLPRVLGVIPGLYLFPALGLAAIAARIAHSVKGRVPSAPPRLRPSAPLLLCSLALLIPAVTTYRDYFRVWGPSAATFDAFEGDVSSAAQWLQSNKVAGHVYLSADLYRHPTFVLLYEHESVQTFFSYYDPNLSMFDARGALPLPPAGAPATYLIGASAPVAELGATVLQAAEVQDVMLDPAGAPALTVLALPAAANLVLPLDAASAPVAFTEQLALLAAKWTAPDGGNPMLMLAWRTKGPVQADWGGYRLEVAAGEQVVSAPFDAFRGPEWVPGGRFITWHRLDLLGPVASLRLRLVRTADGQPLALPGAPDGWHAVSARVTL